MSEVVYIQNPDNDSFEKTLEKQLINFKSGMSVAVKLHMGEPKNKYFPKPELAKLVVDELINILIDFKIRYIVKRSVNTPENQPIGKATSNITKFTQINN